MRLGLLTSGGLGGGEEGIRGLGSSYPEHYSIPARGARVWVDVRGGWEELVWQFWRKDRRRRLNCGKRGLESMIPERADGGGVLGSARDVLRGYPGA